MPKRTIDIQKPCSINIENDCLIVDGGVGRVSVPLEDIWVLIIETPRARITTAALSTLANAGIGTMTCDSQHMPNGLLLPIGAHSRHAAIVKDQLAIKKPLAKRLWQAIVKQKIENQARVLDVFGLDSKQVRRYVSTVASGDKGNREATAAVSYFKLFLPDGTRRESTYTAALDYGYAVLRGGVGRTAVSGGWLVSRGLHHDNDLNAFNLVDDLIEPFRPVVDLMVRRDEICGEFTPAKRARLAGVFEERVLVAGDVYNVQSAIVEELKSLRRAVLLEDAAQLTLPGIIVDGVKR